MMNGSDFEWQSKMELLNHSKYDQLAAILNSSGLVPFSNGQDYRCGYGLDHSNTKPSQIPTLKCLDFKWVLSFCIRALSVLTQAGHCLL